MRRVEKLKNILSIFFAVSAFFSSALSCPVTSEKLEARRLLVEAEQKAALKTALKGEAYPMEDLQEAWKFLISEEPLPCGKKESASFEERRDLIKKAMAISTRIAGNGRIELAKGKSVVVSNAENKWYKISVEENGEIFSIYDKELKRELLKDVANRFIFVDVKSKTAQKKSTVACKRNVVVKLDDKKKLIHVENKIRFNANSFNGMSRRCYGYISFPFDIPKGKAFVQASSSVETPATNAPVHVRDWSAVENGEFGVALIQIDSLLSRFDVNEEFFYSINSCVFNDCYCMSKIDKTDFDMVFRYAITSYQGSWRDNHIPSFVEDVINPFTKEVEKFVKTSAPNIRLSTLKASKDGNGYIVKFVETEGRPTKAKLLHSLLESALVSLVDAEEKHIKDIEDDEISFKAYETVTLLLHNGKRVNLTSRAAKTKEGM